METDPQKLQLEQTASPAQALGLIDGQFTVKRSPPQEGDDPYYETGWNVRQTFEGPTKDGGTDSYTEIGLHDESGNLLALKTMPTSELLAWQPQNEDADETIPRDRLRVENVENNEIISPEIPEMAGDIAVEQVIEEPGQTHEVETDISSEAIQVNHEDLVHIQLVMNDVLGVLQRNSSPNDSARATEQAVGHLYAYALQRDADPEARKAIELFAAGLEIATQPEHSHAYAYIQRNIEGMSGYERNMVQQLDLMTQDYNEICAREGREMSSAKSGHDLTSILQSIESSDDKFFPNRKAFALIVSGVAIGHTVNGHLTQEIFTQIEKKYAKNNPRQFVDYLIL